MENNKHNEVETALESIRPYLKADGGDVELVQVSEDGIVEVKLMGACVGCPMSQMTLRAGVERALIKAVPGIRRVEAVD
ncbi:MAG: NifU family protein [Ignavibacteriales bacterium]|nr:NifU family protein [Ignavibacteriales bacterium]MCF8438586.1 NifU family protein [Ignavibacteriales bacterium]